MHPIFVLLNSAFTRSPTTAVDEIIERLTLLKLRDGDLNQYDADMVRIGQSDKMRDAVSTQLSLDAQVDAFLNMTPGLWANEHVMQAS